jgi:hypothetical protein
MRMRSGIGADSLTYPHCAESGELRTKKCCEVVHRRSCRVQKVVK